MGQMKDNVRLLSKAHSTKVALVVSALIAYWLQLPPAEQQALLAAYPWLKHVAPLAALGAFVVSRVWPQGLQMPLASERHPLIEPDEPWPRRAGTNPDPAYPKPPAPPPPPPVAASPRRPLTPEETRTVLEAARILNERNLT